MKCVKYLLFIFNLLFFIIGLALIIVGALVQTKLSQYAEFSYGTVNLAAVFFIVIGAIVFIIGFFGCCGAHKESYCMTLTFSVLLAIVFIIEIGVAITVYVARSGIEDSLEKEMQKSIKKYGNETAVTKAWDEMQESLKCCGYDGPNDWNDDVPKSCCDSMISSCTALNSYQDGCVEKVFDFMKENILLIGGIGIGLAFVQIVGIVIACCLAQAIRKEYESV